MLVTRLSYCSIEMRSRSFSFRQHWTWSLALPSFLTSLSPSFFIMGTSKGLAHNDMSIMGVNLEILCSSTGNTQLLIFFFFPKINLNLILVHILMTWQKIHYPSSLGFPSTNLCSRFAEIARLFYRRKHELMSLFSKGGNAHSYWNVASLEKSRDPLMKKLPHL